MSLIGGAVVKKSVETLIKTVLGDKGMDILMRCIDRVIPMNEDQKRKLELELAKEKVEMAKVEIEQLEAKTEYVRNIGDNIKDYVIPTGIFIYLGMHTLNFIFGWGLVLFGRDVVSMGISSEFTEIIKTIIMFFFGYKGATKIWSK